jgi:hypothetical protein
LKKGEKQSADKFFGEVNNLYKKYGIECGTFFLSWKQLYSFQGKKLFVLGTSSRKDVLQEMEMANVFSAIVHVSNISSSEQLLTVLDNVDAFNEKELEIIRKKTTGVFAKNTSREIPSQT